MLKFKRSDLNEVAPPMEKRPNRTFYAQIMEGIVWPIAGDLWPGWKDSLQIEMFFIKAVLSLKMFTGIIDNGDDAFQYEQLLAESLSFGGGRS